tara:strand:+ start:2397 stop:3125 length:729 start_codon:yes stop_codon:yes gene_type:complete
MNTKSDILIKNYIKEILIRESIRGTVAPDLPDESVGTLPTPDEIFGPGGLRDVENFFRNAFGIFTSLGSVILSKVPELGFAIDGVGSFFGAIEKSPITIRDKIAKSILGMRTIKNESHIVNENQSTFSSVEDFRSTINQFLDSAKDIKTAQNNYDIVKGISSAHSTDVAIDNSTLYDFLNHPEVISIISNFLKEAGAQTISSISSAISAVPSMLDQASLSEEAKLEIKSLSKLALNSEYLRL